MNSKFLTLKDSQVNEFTLLLEQAILDVKLDLETQQKQQLLNYLDKLLTWNKAYNLTAIKQPKEALIKHIFDCMAIVPFLQEGALLDIGTGAGLPSVVVAICQPDREVTALDSNQKKIRFIKQVISELKLENVTPIASRIENFEGKFGVITSRAFASLSDFVTVAAPYLKEAGYLQAMKGVAPTPEELAELQSGDIEQENTISSIHNSSFNENSTWVSRVIPVSVPNLPDSRHIVELQRAKKS